MLLAALVELSDCAALFQKGFRLSTPGVKVLPLNLSDDSSDKKSASMSLIDEVQFLF